MIYRNFQILVAIISVLAALAVAYMPDAGPLKWLGAFAIVAGAVIVEKYLDRAAAKQENGIAISYISAKMKKANTYKKFPDK